MKRTLKRLLKLFLEGDCYPSLHKGLFSPLLVLRDFAAKGRSISVLSKQYKTSYLFYVTLSFLCDIICYLISVFVFSLETLFGATTYWRRGTQTKKGTLQQAKGVNRTTYWRRYIARTKRYPTTCCSRIYNKVPAYNEPNKIFVKQLHGIKLYKRRSVSDSGYFFKNR